MRHGETLFNVQHKIQGWCDSPLTEKGIKQAQKARDYFSKKGITFDHAYCSTSERCSDTLELPGPSGAAKRRPRVRVSSFPARSASSTMRAAEYTRAKTAW